MEITYETRYAVDTDADCIINSANGLLIPDSSGAGRIRETSGKLNKKEKEEVNKLLAKMPENYKQIYEKKEKKHNWQEGYNQLACLKLIKNETLKPGQAIQDKNWAKKDKRLLIHAITMSYDSKTGKRIQGNTKTIQSSYKKAIDIAIKNKHQKIAMPIPIARINYGLSPKKSYETVKLVLEKFKKENIQITLCFDNKDTKEYLERTKNGKTKKTI